MASERYELSLTGASPQAQASASTATMSRHEIIDTHPPNSSLHRQTLRKLDCLLLPFLALLFLFNALDKSNIGNAESAHFTSDIGLERGDLNTAVALFFAFFVALQPAGAALGRKYGMVRWVPSCMLIWGISTALHAWIRHKWQLYLLRVIIGAMEAGFYPVTVAYLSLFYTRFEFGRRLSLFYGQAAVGGALGGVLSYFVFSRFTDEHDENSPDGDTISGSRWRPWQTLFLLEGGLTVLVALLGYFWLPHNAETAWFLTPEEREYASTRVIKDRAMQGDIAAALNDIEDNGDEEEHGEFDEESRGLLRSTKISSSSARNAVDDRGLSPHDIVSSFLNIKIWHILICNILSAVPVYAFSVFLPLVLAPLTKTPNPALVNLLTAPPYICGAITLYVFASYSDKHRKRIVPVLVGLAIVIVGLTLVVSLPETKDWAIPRYLSLNVLLSGTFVASPLTVAWISGNTPSPGKRTLLLGINGWGNLAGVLSAILFKPKYAEFGYIVPFWWTLGCVGVAALGYVLLLRNLVAENAERRFLLSKWDEDDIKRERNEGRGPLAQDYQWMKPVISKLRKSGTFTRVADWMEQATQGSREGDEKITFIYGH